MNRPPLPILIIAILATFSGLGTTITLFSDFGQANLWLLYSSYVFPVCGILLLFRVRVAYWLLLTVLGLAVIGGVSLILMTSLNVREQPYSFQIVGLTTIQLVLLISLRGKAVRHWIYSRSDDSLNSDAQNARAG